MSNELPTQKPSHSKDFPQQSHGSAAPSSANAALPASGSAPVAEAGAPPPGRVRKVVQRLLRSDAQVEAARLQGHAERVHANTIAQIQPRQHVQVLGTVRSVTVRPRSGRPVLEAQLYDGSAQLALCWLGRRSIPGISAGRLLHAQGLVCLIEGKLTMFNPRYELIAPEAAPGGQSGGARKGSGGAHNG